MIIERIFGGYASIKWIDVKDKGTKDGFNSYYYGDSEAFVFSVSGKTKHEQY